MDTIIFEQTLDKFISAGRQAMEFRAQRNHKSEDEMLEFMDSLWDRMPLDRRRRAEEALRENGLEELANRVIDGRK